MLIDKLPWCSHQGDPIFSIHVHPKGGRFASGGADHSVKVWNILPALDARQENNSATHKLLATMTDHNGPVNVVRFSYSGQYLASGSDDGISCIYELRSGSGGSVLGGESNIENWRTKHIMRGHSSHVVDLGWSPDDSKIATASLDSTVAIWDASNGSRITTLHAHSSFVKGVAWDPVGTYLATLSEDRSLIIWKTDDWSLVAVVESPFERMVTATFACRLSWSPDGRFLLAGNSFQGATHAAVAIPRESWDKPSEYLLVCGHGGAVVATAFCPVLFKVPPLGGGEPGEELSAVFAIGGQDKRMTVWASSAKRPIFCGSKIFKSQVLDLAWTPDGMSLLASSSDGTVAVLQFEKSELGNAATKAEMEEVMTSLYGSSTGRTNKRAFAESAEQLELEEGVKRRAFAPVLGAEQKLGGHIVQQQISTQAHSSFAPPLVPSQKTQIQPQIQKQIQIKPSQPVTVIDPIAALDARLGGSGAIQPGAITQTGFDGSATAAANGPLTITANTLPHQQTQQRMAPSAQVLLLSPLQPFSPSFRTVISSVPPLIGSTSTPVKIEILVENKKGTRLGSNPLIDITCLDTDDLNEPLWTDSVPGIAVGIAGTPSFCAIATADGHVIIYTPSGRRAVPPIYVGRSIARLSAHTVYLLVISTSGNLRLLNVQTMAQVMTADVGPLLLSSDKNDSNNYNTQRGILDVRHSASSGLPILTLTDSTAYIWHQPLQCWMRVADDSLATSRFAPIPRLPGEGELATVQLEALKHGPRGPAARLVGNLVGGTATALTQQKLARGVAEYNMAAAEALGSVEEYTSWLEMYTRLLTEAGDETRLRELVDSLLVRNTDEADTRDHNGLTHETPLHAIDKLALLRKIVFHEIAQNRALGGLLNRCRQALHDVVASSPHLM